MTERVGLQTRFEVKMTCDEMYLPDARAWVRLHPDVFGEAYPPRQVNNLYFDTPDLACLDANLVGVSDRAKLRLRWYGTDHVTVRGALELKHKVSQVGWKEICPIPDHVDLTTTSWFDLLTHLKAHATGQVGLWLAAADLPVLINSYMREYYESGDRQIRVTLDYEQVAYDQLMFPHPNLSLRAPAESRVVVEVKADSRLHRRVSEVVSSFPLQTDRNSKYVNGVMEALSWM
ncbi:MAG: VTC domain-containing protein [Anaerolineae bacterium]|nr:VTC domain-containing protein [Anaerolineae bacterium]